jgi:hypothetical protein
MYIHAYAYLVITYLLAFFESWLLASLQLKVYVGGLAACVNVYADLLTSYILFIHSVL